MPKAGEKADRGRRASSGDGSRGSAVTLSLTPQLHSELKAGLPRHLVTSWSWGIRA